MNSLGLLLNFMTIISISLAFNFIPRVKINNGTLEGMTMMTRQGRRIAAFKNIPYALPPIGPLRFKPPQPAQAWNGTRSARDDVPICMQEENEVFNINPDDHMTEDCLHLNVYTPQLRNRNTGARSQEYPVMVWIHGGGFYSGTSHSQLYSPKFLLDNDIILVTVNYRLGAFGFLSTGDDAAHGNQGLKDQVQSLRWVKENIEAFGGNPNSVTIFGESAGAVSVHHLMMSPLARGLFHRAISQSGTSLNPWAIYSNVTARTRAFVLGKELNCNDRRTEQLIKCLQTKNPQEIVGVSTKWKLANDVPPHFRPVVESDHRGAFLNEDPITTIKFSRVANVPWLNGVNADEGSLVVAPLFGLQPALVPAISSQFALFAPTLLIYAETCPNELHTKVATIIRDHYFQNQSIDESTIKNLIDLDSDVYFKYGHVVSVLDTLKTNHNIYYYQFKYKSTWTWSTLLGDPTRNYGICHADDLQYLFPIREIKAPQVYSEQDLQMVNLLTRMWTNFASIGRPTTSDIWRPVKTNTLEQLVIESSSMVSMKKDLWTDKYYFWRALPCEVGLAPSKASITAGNMIST